MAAPREVLLQEIKNLEVTLNFLNEERLHSLAGKGQISIILYKRLKNLLSASEKLLTLARQEMEDEQGQ